MPNINPEIIRKKRKAFQSEIKYFALGSAAGAAVPLPGLSIAVDAAVLVGAVTHYVCEFGLDIPSLKRLSDRTGVPYADLRAVIISPLAAVEITKVLLLKVIAQVGIKMEDTKDSCPEEIHKDLKKNNIAAAAEKIKEYLKRQDNIPLNIAITGESGAGKSTFVNAFRGLSVNDEGAAPTGAIETTIEVTEYPHPNYPNVKISDLPGIGTTKFPADEYLQHVCFEKYDFFIIISQTRFTESDVKLAQEIQKMKKKFYFVRSKIDNDIRAEERKKDFNKERTLKEIRDNCVEGLQGQGIESPQVFLVSSVELHLYDFPLLQQTLERELPAHKKDALLFAMPNINLEIISKKKEAFKSKIKYFALLSAAGAAVPVPGLSIAVDLPLLVGNVTNYVFGFGLDIQSLQRLSESSGVPYADLQAVIISPLAAVKITGDLVLKVISQIGGTAVLMAAEEATKWIPFIGIPISMSFSFGTTYNVLNFILNILADDAQKVFKKALGLNTSE
ncbi:unnamed protein product [Oreochromis niloticus]|nr:unnamed protein product [Mustela putorius furo]